MIHVGHDIVTRAAGNVFAFGPDRRTRIIRKQRPLELVTVILPQRIGRRAHRVTHGIGALRIIRRPCEDRNHNQPAVSELVVTHNRIAVVAHAAAHAETRKNGVVGDRAVEKPALLCEDGHIAVQNFEDMIGPDREADVDATTPSAASGKSLAEAVETYHRLDRGALTLRRLLNCGSLRR